MSTATPSPARTSSDRPRSDRPVADALRWVRETPAPRWTDQAPRARSRFAGYLAVNLAAWTAVGLGGAALFGRAVEGLAALVG